MNVSEHFFDVRLYYYFDYSLRLIAVILQEPLQTDLNSEFNSIFAEIGNTEAVSFDINYVQLDRENLDASFGNREFLKNDNFPYGCGYSSLTGFFEKIIPF